MNSQKNLKTFAFRAMDYEAAMARQLELVGRCIDSGGVENFLMPVEHPPVITLGRSAGPRDLRSSRAQLSRRGVAVVETNRGGKTTFHGPGQLIMYPIMDLHHRGRDLHRYLRDLEAWLIRLLSAYGIVAHTNPPHTGAWVEGAKIASIGIAARRWVAYHGVALNVNTEMSFFDYIVPCGLDNVKMTSMASLTRHTVPLEEVAAEADESFRKHFGF